MAQGACASFLSLSLFLMTLCWLRYVGRHVHGSSSIFSLVALIVRVAAANDTVVIKAELMHGTPERVEEEGSFFVPGAH